MELVSGMWWSLTHFGKKTIHDVGKGSGRARQGLQGRCDRDQILASWIFLGPKSTGMGIAGPGGYFPWHTTKPHVEPPVFRSNGTYLIGQNLKTTPRDQSWARPDGACGERLSRDYLVGINDLIRGAQEKDEGTTANRVRRRHQ